MTDLQNRRYNMALAVLRFCLSEPAVLNLNLAFKKSVNRLQELTDATLAAMQGQAEDTSGVRDVKAALRANLVHIAAKVSSLLSAYAADKGDAALGAKAGWTERKLERLNENELPTHADNLAKDAAPAAAAADAGEYGLSPALLTELKAAVGAFREAKDLPRNATAARSTDTLTLAETMRATSRHLREKMDKLVEFYKTSHPQFYTTYKENRKVMNAPTRKKTDAPGV
jgi:uncharacterized protein YdbL (DUF1318 family)